MRGLEAAWHAIAQGTQGGVGIVGSGRAGPLAKVSLVMPFTPIANCTMCKLRYTNGTNHCENTFAYKWSNPPPSAAELSALAQEVWGTIGAKMRRQMHSVVTFVEVECTNLDVPNGNFGRYTVPSNTRGIAPGQPASSNVAASITKYTGVRGRSYRGRNSFSEFAEGDIDGNSLGSLLMSWLLDLILSLVAQRVAGRFAPAVASKKLGVANVINSGSPIDNFVDSQKTRLNNRGS